MKSTDIKKFGKVAVLFGGLSAEREISIASGQAVLAGLLESGVDAHGIDAGLDIAKVLETGSFDSAFIVMHGRGGEDGAIQGLLEWLQIPYTGSNIMSSSLGMDKVKTKQIWQAIGLPTADFAVLTETTDFPTVIDSLGGKAIVKPSREGSSIGMSIATDALSLKQAYELASKTDDQVIAEKWIDGAEYTVAILNNSVLPIIKLQAQDEFYDFNAKYKSNSTEYLIPSGLSDSDTTKMEIMALKGFKSIGCSGWGRVDLMVDADGTTYLLEVNTVPGMTEHSLVPKAAAASGLEFNELLLNILSEAKLHNGVA